MDPSVLDVTTAAVKPPKWWILAIAAAGAVGSLGSVAVAGSGTYDVAPFKIRLEAMPAPLGETVLNVQPLEGAVELPLRAEAGTHASPVVAKATIVGTTTRLVRSDLALLDEPFDVASFIGAEGKTAVRSFAIKVGGIAIGGGGLAGLLLSFGRWRRVAGGAVAGLLTFGSMGLLMQQTYDTNEFQKTCFVVNEICVGGDPIPDDLPGDLPDGLPT